MKISLLLPTRNRFDNLKRFCESVVATADDLNLVEVVAYVDNDDASYDGFEAPEGFSFKMVRGDRLVLSELWNVCWRNCTGEIFGHMGDDIVFRSQGWDTNVREAFKNCEDKILFAFGDDGYWGDRFGTHGFIHRNWTDVVGNFLPPFYSSDWNDQHLNDISVQLGRRVYLPDVTTEHMHYVFGKAERDITHQEREERGARDSVRDMYYSEDKTRLRYNEIEALKRFIDDYKPGRR